MTQILVVEDEAIIARDITSTLTDLGYGVAPAVDSAESAFASISEARPDLVLMDIRLRGELDGIEAAQRIRNVFAVPVVFLTSHADELTIQRAKATGAYGYVLKPFSDRDLRTAIEVALEKHAIERQMSERERWFATTLRSIGDAVIATDRDQRISFMNAVAERITGWTSTDAHGKPLGEVLRLVHAKTGVALPSPLTRAFEQGFAVDLPREAALRARAGELRDVDDSAAPIIDDQGKLVGGVVIFRDVTERRELDERLAHNERLASIGTLSAGMAHEINNPLAYVLANVSHAVERLPALEAKVRSLVNVDAEALGAELAAIRMALREAQEGSERVHAIVHDLKKFGRVDTLALAPVDLVDAMNAALRALAKREFEPRLRREYEVAPFVMANASQLEQVFTNLLINACEASRSPGDEIVVKIFTDDTGRAVVQVRDHGIGISPELQRRIFDPFFTTKEVGKGVGLGLSIAHSIVGAFGGALAVTSVSGTGSTFRIVLPGIRTDEVMIGAEIQLAPKRRGRVLVIDDEPAIGRAITRVLQADHDVFMVTAAREAVASIAAGQVFDIILCDLMMPEMTGMDFHAALARDWPSLVSRIVFVTGGVLVGRVGTFLDSVGNLTLTKPVAPVDLREIVTSYVNKNEGPE